MWNPKFRGWGSVETVDQLLHVFNITRIILFSFAFISRSGRCDGIFSTSVRVDVVKVLWLRTFGASPFGLRWRGVAGNARFLHGLKGRSGGREAVSRRTMGRRWYGVRGVPMARQGSHRGRGCPRTSCQCPQSFGRGCGLLHLQEAGMGGGRTPSS